MEPEEQVTPHSIEEDDDVITMEEASYHPSAPSSELFDMRTTVDPSYIISLIRKLLPQNHGSPKELETGFAEKKNVVEAMDTYDEKQRLSRSAIDEAAWEECGCILWDLAVNKNHALFMVENLILEVLLATLTVSKSVRVTEIGLGILANIACHEVLGNHLVSTPGLIDIAVEKLFLDDSLCLCEAFRLFTLGLQGSDSVVWAKTLHSEHILSRILWIAENTLNPQLLEKSTGLLLAVVESQQEVSQFLLPQLMPLGLPDLLISLFACEMKHLSGEKTSDRYPVLDTILRVIEALSALDNYSKLISSNKELLQLIYDLLTLPDKVEVSSSCVTAVVLMANILTDEPDLTSVVSQDLPLLRGLLGLIPSVSNDLEARNALWSVLGRFLVCIQEDEMSPSSLHQYVAAFVEKYDIIQDDIIDHQFSSTEAASLSRINSILQWWIEVKENVKNDIIGVDGEEDEIVEKLRKCCEKRNSTG
ncbi:hypothetical protein ACHQM5_020330 [Ranunculus cassubicifolius]